MDPCAQGPDDVKYSTGALGGPAQHRAKANDQHWRDFCHLSSRCECIKGELGHIGNTCFTIPHKESNRNCRHLPKVITFRHSAAGTFPLLFMSEEIYTPRQLRKPLKWVRNQEPHVEQLILNFLPAAQLRSWPECFNLHQTKKSSVGQHQRAQFRHTGVMRRGTQPPCALLLFTAVLTAWAPLTAAVLRRDVQLWTCLQGCNPTAAWRKRAWSETAFNQGWRGVYFSHGQNRLA